ncbi:peptide chain release factor N(5)-glutamine methyltransferase [Oceanisphaera arctica]|uniref:Release factor glutamine methyltransferase n=1 Tax=Oceanisphaera arctica TaxID=641510 RepID=A0A2P5TKZ5_9GAMM|nr:peptide chain release factor N(5)-glutamine methyltransferase [Oceanisphaera arctica]PPL15904.1 protein-(glutamine-N5) methyltransferase, release factor-specific [Oceanisphaera arctica]GHA26816.1 release factor glutamine methyltransferase [Oceanisphaera arctica]
MTLAQWRQRLREQLAGGESPALDADVLLCHVLARPRSFLLAWPEYEPTAAECERLNALAARRLDGEPVSYLTGEREFWSLALEVSPATLIPRPDTEIIIEAALARLPARPATLVDLGTGTGAIALALKSERPADTVLAVEYNPDAAALARRNSARLELAIEVHQGSWFEPLAEQCFDMILSNPPYIDAADPHLQSGDVRFEPASALVAKQQGMADLHYLVVQSRDHLEPGGWLLLEHGWQQGALVRNDFTALGYQEVETLRDYGGQERITLAQWPGRLNAENEHQ